MNTRDLLRIKLKNDLLSDLQKEYTSNKILNQLPKEKYIKLIQGIINIKCLNESFELIEVKQVKEQVKEGVKEEL